MDYLHIIMIWILFIILIAGYAIAKICVSKTLISENVDFINNFIQKKKNYLIKNNVNMNISLYLGFMVITPIILGVLLYILTKNAILTVLISVAALLTPEGIIIILKQQANKDFENRYARSLEQLAASLRAGLSISQAVQEVADNKFIHESMRRKYRELSSDLQMGISVSNAFKRFADSTTSQDAHDVALAIDIQNDVGGHETEAIMSIAKDIHDRIMLRREVKSLFSGTMSMVYIMDFLPIGIVIFLCISDRNYISFYFSNLIHMIILIIIVSCCIVGSVINHAKLSKIMKGV